MSKGISVRLHDSVNARVLRDIQNGNEKGNPMKVQFKFYLLTMIAALWLAAAGSVYAASTTINATATVSTATITLTPVNPLNFGTIVSAGAANILVDAFTDGSAATSVVDSGTATISVAGSPGEIDVTSPVSATVNVDFAIADSTAAANQIDDGGGNSMALTATSMYAYSSTGTATPNQLALTAATTSQIYVGGLLQIGATQAAGSYSGTITVTVTY